MRLLQKHRMHFIALSGGCGVHKTQRQADRQVHTGWQIDRKKDMQTMDSEDYR
jgi:hypothetical protein